jgi:hypothetical protein
VKSYSRQIQLAVAILVLVACRCTGPTDNGNKGNVNQSVTKPPKTSSPAADGSQVSRRNASVILTNAQQNSQRLADDGWHDLNKGDRIATDANGEAEVNILNCMRVYVFRDSQLMRSACPKSAYKSGSIACAAAGTSLFNNTCSNKVIIQTDTADIAVEGTYFSVTYLASAQLTLVLVLKGKVNVRSVAVVDDQRTLGEAVEIPEGNFVISVPDDKKGAIPQLNGLLLGTPISIERLADVTTALKLQPWIERVVEQAKTDNIAVAFSALNPPTDTTPASSSLIDCDCANVSAGLLTDSYKRQCKDAENRLKQELVRTGNVSGKCDSVASGPNARPK